MKLRAGAVESSDLVVVLEESAIKENAKACGRTAGVGLDLETMLTVKVRVRHLGETQYSWVDLHVFDDGDRVIRSETLPLHHVGPAEDDGDVFVFEGYIYRGTGASPGSVWLAPDARKVQYRLYYEVNGTVFTDGLLRQHDVPPDSELTHCGVARRTGDGGRRPERDPENIKQPSAGVHTTAGLPSRPGDTRLVPSNRTPA